AHNAYANLRVLFLAKTASHVRRSGESNTLVEDVIDGIQEVASTFKLMPGHEKHYVPRSEYLFKLLQPLFDDLLFLGSEYEAAFDRFEIFLALEYSSQSRRDGAAIW